MIVTYYRQIITALLIAGFVFFSGVQDAGAGTMRWNEADIAWHDYDEGLAAAKQENKPAILIIYEDWCPACRKYENIFYDPEIVKHSAAFVMIKVNRTEHPEISRQYDVDGQYIPRTFALSPHGNILSNLYQNRKYRYYLGTEKQPLISLMQKILQKQKTTDGQ